MLPLIKIRLTYLKRKKCTLVFSYLLIPIILLFGIIIYVAKTKGKDPAKYNPKQTFPFDYDKSLFTSQYDDIIPYLKNTSLITKNEKKGQNFALFIKEKFNIDINISPDEKSVDKSYKNLIIMNYNEKKDAYTFLHKQNKGSSGYDEEGPFGFPFSLMSSQDASNIFSYYSFNYDNSENEINFDDDFDSNTGLVIYYTNL